MRRALVLWLVALCAFILVAPPDPFEQYGLVFLLVLVALNLVLRRVTRRLAVAPDRALDERDITVRNRAYRLSYRVLAVVFGVPLWLIFLTGGKDPSWLSHAMSVPGIIIGSLELLYFLPTAIIAWIEPDQPVDEEDLPVWRLTTRQRLSLALLSVLVLTPFAWSTGVAFAGTTSTQYKPWPRVVHFGKSSTPAHCARFDAIKNVGNGIEARVHLATELCWNGKHIWQTWGLNRSDCRTETEFFATADMRCRTRFHRDGTIDVLYRAEVRPTLLPFIDRVATIRLVIRPDGTMVRFP